jgi:predicted ATPase
MIEESGGKDRITEVRIQGMRALADVRLPLGGLTVLIGENGSGKSTILEALELLRQAAAPTTFINDQLGPSHGGLDPLLRAGERTLRIGVRVEGGGPPLDYAFALSKQGTFTIISEERLQMEAPSGMGQASVLFERDASACRFFDPKQGKMADVFVQTGDLALQGIIRKRGTAEHPPLVRVIDALGAGQVHVPFDVRAIWVGGAPSFMRFPADLDVAGELHRGGGNLANCYHALLNGSPHEVRERTIERVRHAFDGEVVDIHTRASGRGQIELRVALRGLPQPISALTLSDGQLAYLAFVALAELGKRHSFVAFDEPESHLHPGLLVRVVWLLEELAESCPVILATQSDRLLDALSEPEKSVVLCQLDESLSTQLLRPDPEVREKWLKRYRGIGELRAEGFTPHVFNEPLGNGK